MKTKKSNIIEYNWQSQIVHAINEGICVVSPDNLISFINPAAARMLGWQEDELIGQHYELLFGIETKSKPIKESAFICPVQFALIEGESIHVNTDTFYCRDNSTILVEYICVPLKEAENIVAAVITFEDISERRDLEDAVAKARDAAIEAARIRSDFLANMSHEIRTPLNGIIGIADLLNSTQLTTEQIRYLEILKTSSTLLLQIVNDILDFSKIEANKLQLENIEFDLSKIINETIELFLLQANKKGIQLKSEIDKGIIVAVKGDASRLKQILNNLLSNAIKFTLKGKVLLKVSPSGNEFMLFEVIDTGIGIEPQKQLKIFEPFMQGDVSTTREFGGTGLGLAISKQLVEMMEGKIGVTSELGKGTTFWFTIKLSNQSFVAGSLGADLTASSKNDSKTPVPKVLVVEDNPINQEVALGRLRQLGIVADVVPNGIQALKIVQDNHYDLILMDCRMPEMDGFEATRRIRELGKEFQSIKIIAMTASVTVGERERCISVGMDDYLSKPMTIEALAETISLHLNYQFNFKKLDLKKNIRQHPLADIIDGKTLQNLMEIESRGEKDFVREMLDFYLSHSETQVSQLKIAFLNRDLTEVKNKAHALRGSSGNIGLMELFRLFGELEEAALRDWNEAEKTLTLILEQLISLKNKVSQISEVGE